MRLLSQPPFDPTTDLPDLTGKVAIVTGGNSGIGYATVLILARKGAKVYLAARNEARAAAAIARLAADGLGPGNGAVFFLKLDLADPHATKAAADAFLEMESRLDILVNNAAMVQCYFVMTSLGVLEGMVTNHFSPFVFTQTLLPLLTATAQQPGADVRIVNLSSDSHTHVPTTLRFRSKADYNTPLGGKWLGSFRRYGATKLANILWTRALQCRIDAQGAAIACVAVHPGAVKTEGALAGASKLPLGLGRVLRTIITWFFASPVEGAYTSVIAAAGAVRYKGAYLVPVGRVGQTSEVAASVQAAEELWESTEAVLCEWGLRL